MTDSRRDQSDQDTVPPAAEKAYAPLTDLTVIDCCWLLPGQFAAQILGDLGARILKIEHPDGDYARDIGPFGYAAVNRGKEGLTLNLKQEGADEVLRRLVARADVFIEGFRPGVMARLGGSWDELRAVRPELVYCSISGFGQDGQRRARVGHGLNYASLAGMQSRAGRSTTLTPVLADLAGSLYAVIAILAALKRPGRGQFIDLSITDAVYGLMSEMLAGNDLLAHESDDAGAGAFGVFEARGGDLMSVGAVEDVFWRALCVAVGHPEWPDRTGWGVYEERRQQAREIRSALEEVFALRPRTEWLHVLGAAGVPAEAVNDLAEATVDPLAMERGLVSWVDEPGLGKVAHVRFPALFSDSDPAPAGRAPEIGEHTDAILAELGFSPAQVQDLKRRDVV